MAFTREFIEALFTTLGNTTAISLLINKANDYGKTLSVEFFKSIIDNFGIDGASRIIAAIFQEMSRDQDDENIERILKDVRREKSPQKEKKQSRKVHRSRSRSRSPRHRSRRSRSTRHRSCHSHSSSPHKQEMYKLHESCTLPIQEVSKLREPFMYKYLTNVETNKESDIKKSAQRTIANANIRNINDHNILRCDQTFHDMIQLFDRMSKNGMNYMIGQIRLFPSGYSFKVSLFDVINMFSFTWIQSDMEYNYRMIIILEKANKFMLHLLSNFRAFRRQDAVVVQVIHNYEIRDLIVKIIPTYHGVGKFIGFYIDDGKQHTLIEVETDIEFLEKLNQYHEF